MAKQDKTPESAFTSILDTLKGLNPDTLKDATPINRRLTAIAAVAAMESLPEKADLTAWLALLESDIGCVVGKGKKGASDRAEKRFAWRAGTFPVASLHRMLAYGCQRLHNDKVGGDDVSLEEKVKIVDKVHEALIAGIVTRIATDDGPSGFMREAAVTIMRAAGHKFAKVKKDDKAAIKAREDSIKAFIESNREVVTEHAATLEAADKANRELAAKVAAKVTIKL